MLKVNRSTKLKVAKKIIYTERLIELYARIDAHKGIIKLKLAKGEKETLIRLQANVDRVVAKYSMYLANIKSQQITRFI